MQPSFEETVLGRRATPPTAAERQQGFCLLPTYSPQGPAGQAAMAGKPLVNAAGDQYLFRFGMTIVPLDVSDSRTVVVVMMNPGSAGKWCDRPVAPDRTVKRLADQLRSECGRIITVNTMPFYDSASQHLRQTIRDLQAQGITPADWSAGNVSTLRATLAILDQAGLPYDVLLGTGNLQSYNRAEFSKLMRVLPSAILDRHLYAGKLLKSGDSGHLNPQGPLFGFKRADWIPVKLKSVTTGRTHYDHLVPRMGD